MLVETRLRRCVPTNSSGEVVLATASTLTPRSILNAAMGVMADVSKLLFNTVGDPNFLAEITLKDHELKDLDEAKKLVRQHLRDTFAGISKQLLGARITPRFFTQGSRAYRTLNRGAWMPPQQIDLDDGVYLPMSFMQSTSRPSVAASAFFKVVDSALIELARQEKWKFDGSKPTCARLIISAAAHIDVPMYAIPDKEFETLEKAAQQMGINLRNLQLLEARWPADTWDVIPDGKVLLAHREEDWMVSDPRKIHAWFIEAVEMYGEILRRICRYLKAWRDFYGKEMDNVSSILLMTCAFMAFKKVARVPSSEHAAFLAIARELPAYLAGEIRCIPDPAQRLDTKMSDAERRKAIDLAKALVDKLETTLENCFSSAVAISNMQDVLGSRFPNRPDLVKVKAEPEHAIVFAAPREIVPAPQVTRSRSG